MRSSVKATPPTNKPESGSIAPLAVGFLGILIATLITFIDANALLIFQQRKTQTAEAIALAVSAEVSETELSSATTDSSKLLQMASDFAVEAKISDHIQVLTRDGLTVEARVCASFHAPIEIPILQTQTAQEICGLARARKI